MLNLTCNFNLITKIFIFSSSRLLKLAATVMTVEFGIIQDYSSLEEISEAFLCSSLNRYQKKKKITDHSVNHDNFIKNNHDLNSNMNTN